ncbi:MAG: catechol 2,3-dioxygenase [Gammaproteobacteria bacterium]|jgi:catechol 2,3-dioxygenase
MSSLPAVRFKHMGINCADIDLMTEFYCRVMGFVVSDEGVASFGSRIAFLTQDVEEHHQLVLIAGRPNDVSFNTINQFSCKLDDLATLRRYLTILSDHGVSDIAQVDHGNAWSVYFPDPEGNTIELYVDTPFYSPQPCREPLDLTNSESEILARTESMCRQRPGFMTREQWQTGLRERIATTRA